jgi:hypothetical protein
MFYLSRYLGYCLSIKAFSIAILFFLFTTPSFSQMSEIPDRKWEGTIKLVLNNKTVVGNVTLDLGKPDATAPIELDISLEKSGGKEIKLRKLIGVNEVKSTKNEDGIISFTFKSGIPLDNNEICPGIFHFENAFRYFETKESLFTFVLFGDFEPLENCKTGKIEFSLFPKSQLKNWAKQGLKAPELIRVIPKEKKPGNQAIGVTNPLINNIPKEDQSKASKEASNVVHASTPSEKGLSEGAALMFKGVKSTLSVEDRNQIFSYSELRLSDDKTRLLRGDNRTDFISDLEILITDLNGDRIEEVLIYFKASGGPGIGMEKNVMSFIKNKKDGKYDLNFIMQRDKPLIIPRYNGGYPDLFFHASRGNTDYVLSWYGSRYEGMDEETVVNKNAFNKVKTMPIDLIAKAYQDKGYQAARDLQNSLPKISNANYLVSNQGAPLPQPGPKKAYSKTSSAKFIGKYWQLGYYNDPYFITKVGNLFYFKTPTKSGTKIPGFTYNVKADRLETWMEVEGLKFKLLITFDYDAGGVFVYPENRSLRGMFPKHLSRY